MTPSILPVAVPARLSLDDGTDPRIGVANRIFDDVVALVRSAGLTPEIVTDADLDLSRFSAVVLPGGGDVDPTLYGGDPSAPVYDVNAEQDALDLSLGRRAVDAGVPVLAICRGAQVLNVVYGGTLHEDLAASHVPHTSATEDFVWHEVAVTPGSRVAACHDETGAVPTPALRVASAHHQAVRTLGAGLVATAIADDGLVEAFEDPERWVVAVQWHPEAPGSSDAVANGPFRALAGEVGRRASRVDQAVSNS
ncbi:gamma-glutamyl-gamma-aminobutyrate hydrolase family protein [Frondihabitans cladoniiphilus]|uniref:Gamma-glutamyl-gamma-aminobutyrate hydrolase family protein n=1 Tax=Frondihabitans cladoniiphilus TaxID=715785 RepID=A0ABP8VWA5_9MICO